MSVAKVFSVQHQELKCCTKKVGRTNGWENWGLIVSKDQRTLAKREDEQCINPDQLG